MKYIKRLWGYGKTFAKHMWDINKGYLAKRAFQKISNKVRNHVPEKYAPIYDGLANESEKYL